MAQNVTVAGASYSDVPSVTLPKTGGGTASFTDVTGTTALAADVASGKYFFTASGVLTLGTATGGGGLEYETGTWTPATDTANYVIPFAKTHTAAPYYYLVIDASNSYSNTTTSNYSTAYNNFHQMFGTPFYVNNSGSITYGLVANVYRGNSSTAITASSQQQLNTSYTDPLDNSNTCSRYWATETGIRAYTNSTSRYWRSGRTYKWIAIWAPTTS